MQFTQFPRWVDAKKSKNDRAVARLKYMITMLALEHTGRNSVRALAEKVGLDHSTVSKYIKAGAFPERSACQVEVRLGSKSITASMLTDPLSISTQS